MSRIPWAACAALLAVDACSGNAVVPHSATMSSSATYAAARGNATFVIKIPGSSRAKFISPSTQSVVVTLAKRVLVTMDVAASSRLCVPATDRGRICSKQAVVPNGAQTFAIAAYDRSSGTGNLLASGTVTVSVKRGMDLRVPIVLTGEPAQLTLQIADAYPPAGQSASTAVTIEALDADGNTIVGAYQRTVQLNDSDASGATALSATSVTASSDAVTLSYDGSPLGSATIAAQTLGLRKVTRLFAPSPRTVAQYNAPLINSINGPTPVGFGDVCLGPDRHIWVTGTSAGAIVKLKADGKFSTYKVLNSGPIGISAGSHGDLWFAESVVGKIGRATTAGVITSYTIPVPKGASSQPGWTTLGPDGRTWFVDQGYGAVAVGTISEQGKIQKFPLPANSVPTEITAGPDGNLWITDGGLNAIDVVSTQGKVIAVHKLPTANAGPWGITAGPDKNVWFAEFNANQIGRMTIDGTVREWQVPSASAGPIGIASGPDGNVWFTETGGGFWNFSGKVGYITTDGSVIREFPSAPLTGHVHALAFDSKGALWYTQFAGPLSQLSKFVY